jgi:hypothetical protein
LKALRLNTEELKIITLNTHGFSEQEFAGLKFHAGQRTMFYDELLWAFLGRMIADKYMPRFEDLTHKIGVRYQNGIYDYPIQNNLQRFSFSEKCRLFFSYFFRKRKLAYSDSYAEWVIGNYGTFLANNIILPHTWKTIKEDLYTICAMHYGKKVVKMKWFNQPEPVKEIIDSNDILKALEDNVRDNMILGKVGHIFLEKKEVWYDNGKDSACGVDYDTLVNTIPITRFMNLVKLKEGEEVIDVATKSLHYNNMFVGIFVVPSEFLRTDRNIIYFPERNYLFSKVNINRFNGYAVISCEVSFRRNDEKLFESNAYVNKYMERIEVDLKNGGIVCTGMFVSYYTTHKIVSPAYIICNEEYSINNSLLQNYLEHNSIYNIGRFSEWKPNLRIENSVLRAMELGKILFPDKVRIYKEEMDKLPDISWEHNDESV